MKSLRLLLARTHREAVVADMTSPSTDTSHCVTWETFISALANQTTEMNIRMVRKPMEKLAKNVYKNTELKPSF